MFEIGKNGKITDGQFKGWSIFIVDDRKDTGGFLILLSKEDEKFDEWVESEKQLKRWFERKKINIVWEN